MSKTCAHTTSSLFVSKLRLLRAHLALMQARSGAALPPCRRGVLIAGLAFGVLHNSGGRNPAFAAWASLVRGRLGCSWWLAGCWSQRRAHRCCSTRRLLLRRELEHPRRMGHSAAASPGSHHVPVMHAAHASPPTNSTHPAPLPPPPCHRLAAPTVPCSSPQARWPAQRWPTASPT